MICIRLILVAWIFMFFCLMSGEAFACGGCADQRLSLLHSYIPFVFLAGFLWIITAILTNTILTRKFKTEPPKSLIVPGRKAIYAMLLLYLPGTVGLAMMTQGSIMIPMSYVSVIWAVYLLVMIISGFAKKSRDKFEKTNLRLHSAFLIVSLLFVVYSMARGPKPEALIRGLSAPDHTRAFLVVPLLVQKSDTVLPKLIAQMNDDLRDPSSEAQYRLPGAVYALGEAGGPLAEKQLEEMVLRQLPSKGSPLQQKWEWMTCLAYVKVSGEKSVGNLIALHKRTSKEPDSWIILVAIAYSGTREGVSYVMDNSELLVDVVSNSQQSDLDIGMAATVLNGYQLYNSPAGFKDMPVWGLPDLITYQLIRKEEVDKTLFYWKQDSPKIKARWQGLLK